EILEQLRRHQTASPFAGLGLSTDDRTVFHPPLGGAGLCPASEILAVEEWSPRHRRLRRQRQRQARKHERFHGAHSIPSCETIPHQQATMEAPWPIFLDESSSGKLPPTPS